MIISVSRRTDIPAIYSDWFYTKIKEGFVCVRNPQNVHQISKISLLPNVVDCFVFWTKNPVPMINRLRELDKYMYYFQLTVTPYEKDIEGNIPDKKTVIIPAFKELSNKIGSERVIWRYDPILLTSKYNIQYHINAFQEMAAILSGYTKRCVISFCDMYRNVYQGTKNQKIIDLTIEQINMLAGEMAKIAKQNKITIESCAEKLDLEKYGIVHGHCIDSELIERLLGTKINLKKDKNQRAACGCVASIDIGVYNTCPNGCKYCYANNNSGTILYNRKIHNIYSPLLVGRINPDDVVKEVEMKSFKEYQQSIFN